MSEIRIGCSGGMTTGVGHLDRRAAQDGRDTYGYFDNDVKSAASQDADILKSLVVQ